MSKALQRYEELKQLQQNRQQGIMNGIPLWESFPMLSKTIPSIDKGQVILNAAASGVGKSMITRYKDIIVPWLYCKNHPELEIDLQFVIFLLEDDYNRLVDYFISILLFIKYGITVSPKNLRSSYEKEADNAILNKVKELQPDLDDLLNRCDIQDSIYNSYGIYKYCRIKSEEWGTHFYSNLLEEEEDEVITKSQYNDLKDLEDKYKDYSVNELRTKFNLTPRDYKVFWKYSHYEYNNPKQHVIAVVDNINCLEPDKHEKDLKECMDNFMYKYARKNITKHWQWTLVAVQQNVGGAEEQAFTYKGSSIVEKLIPSLDKLGDSKLTQRACHLIYGMFDPFRYGVEEFMDYDISKLQSDCRFLFVLKNNDGNSNVVTPLLFVGESNYFKELPPASKIKDSDYELIKQRKIKIT